MLSKISWFHWVQKHVDIKSQNEKKKKKTFDFELNMEAYGNTDHQKNGLNLLVIVL